MYVSNRPTWVIQLHVPNIQSGQKLVQIMLVMLAKKSRSIELKWAERCYSSELLFTARSSYASAVLGIVILSFCPFVCLSIRPSVRHTRALWRSYRTADILIPHERVIIIVFWYQRRFVGDVPFQLKFALKPTHLLWKAPTSTNICL